MPPRPLTAPADVAEAIAAAVAICWPGGVAEADARSGARRSPDSGPGLAWRFSGRSWHDPVALRRDRPGTGRGW
ncbi:MAG: hypothetical protein ABSF89_11090 [Acidimicrobiales bacterium]|jgi:hypothetical protein